MDKEIGTHADPRDNAREQRCTALHPAVSFALSVATFTMAAVVVWIVSRLSR